VVYLYTAVYMPGSKPRFEPDFERKSLHAAVYSRTFSGFSFEKWGKCPGLDSYQTAFYKLVAGYGEVARRAGNYFAQQEIGGG
jgi:hypothetical protein